MSDLSLILVDPNPALCHEWRKAFADFPAAQIVAGYFEELPAFDCLVSPANSFGMMDGGVDGAIIHFFGVPLMRRVQRMIVEDFLGEQPVGTSVIVATGHAKHPYLAHTPTMRVPMPIARTAYVYTAMWAMLLAVRAHNRSFEASGRGAERIGAVACPGLGTGTGRVPFAEAARQMALAYQHSLAPPAGISWGFASARQDAVRFGGDLGLMVGRKEGVP